MEKFFILYCFQQNEIATVVWPELSCDYSPTKGTYVPFLDETLRIDEIVWMPEDDRVFYCCGILFSSNSGPQDGGGLLFPFGKITEELWTKERLGRWKIEPASYAWSRIISAHTVPD